MNALYESYTRNRPSLIGQRFGRLTVCDVDKPDKWRQMHWICLCDCGVFTTVSGGDLRTDHIRSCGCLRREVARERHFSHGHSGNRSAEYSSWLSAKERCSNPRNKRWSSYGGRGIKMCERWIHSFEAFLEDMGPRPSRNHSIDRWPDNNGNYEPGNCRWATRKEQALNRRSNSHITVRGVTKTIREWSDETGIQRGTLSYRKNAEWGEDQILRKVGMK